MTWSKDQIKLRKQYERSFLISQTTFDLFTFESRPSPVGVKTKIDIHVSLGFLGGHLIFLIFCLAVSPILGLAAASASLFTLASNSSQQSPSRGASAVTPSQAATGGNATAATATPQSSTTKQSKNSHQSIQEASDLVKAKINEVLTLLKDSKVRSWLNWVKSRLTN